MSETPNTPNWQMVRVVDIDPSPLNPRRNFDHDELRRLADDIAVHGVHHPITLREHPVDVFGKYHVVTGERRFRAAQMAGLTHIPAVIRADMTDALHLELAYNENETHVALRPIDCARLYRRMLDAEPGLTQEELGKRLHVSQPRIANRLRLLRLSAGTCNLINDGHLLESVALELCRLLRWPQKLDKAVDMALSENWTQGQAAAYAKLCAEESKRAEEEANQPALPIESGPTPEPPAPTGPDAITKPLPPQEPTTEPEPEAEALPEWVIELRPEFMETAVKANCCQTLIEKKNPTVPLFCHGGEYYLISGDNAKEAWGHHVILRSDYTGPIRTYQECIDRLAEDRATAFTGLVVKFAKKEWVTDGQRVRFVPLSAVPETVEASDSPEATADPAESDTTPQETEPAGYVEPQEAELLASEAEVVSDILASDGWVNGGTLEVPTPKTHEVGPSGATVPGQSESLPQDIEEWLFEQGLTPEQAIRQLMRLKPYAPSPAARRTVDRLMAAGPRSDDPVHPTPGACVDWCIAEMAEQYGLTKEEVL